MEENKEETVDIEKNEEQLIENNVQKETNSENSQQEKVTKEPFKLNPEIKGMIGIFVVILLLGLLMASYMGKLEQWFGIDIFAGSKITDKIVYIEEGDINKIISYDIQTEKSNTILEQKDIKDVAVSFNGKKIAYIAYEGDVPQVFLMNPDGKKSKPITTIEGSKSKPKFSPDGKYLSYIANGRLFRADLNGSNSFSMLPTKQEQQNALNGRNGKLVIKDYVWSDTGEGMLAVVARSDEDERLVIMDDNNGDAHEVPFPEGMNCQFISLSSAADSKSYITVAKSKDVYILFLIQVPEEHNHNAQTAEEMGVVPIPMGKDQISHAFLLPQGAGFMFAMKPVNKKMPEAIYMLDTQNQQLAAAFPWFCDYFQFIYNGKFLMHNFGGTLNILSQDSKEPVKIGDKVQSFSVAPPKEIKNHEVHQ